MKQKIFASVLLLSILCSLWGTASNLYLHNEENNAIDLFIAEMGLTAPNALDKAFAVRVSDALRSCFNTNEKTWKFARQHAEPFLRYSVLELLEHREGKCGKGSRVLLRVLDRLGYDAARITLYGKDLRVSTSHTLVSVMLNDDEHFIDSINSTEEFNRLVREQRVHAGMLNLSGFGKRHVAASAPRDSVAAQLRQEFGMYNYGIPVSQILYKLGIEYEVFNFSRPSAFVSFLAESVYLIKFFICLIFFLLSLYLLYLYRNHLKIILRGNET